MATYDVGLYQAQEIYNQFGDDVIDKVERYLEASTENVSDSLNVSQKGTFTVPGQCKDTSFTTTYPCDTSFDATYNGIYEWWKDFTRCRLDNLASDSNLLITDCDGVYGGGTAEGGSVSDSTRAHANVNRVEYLPSSTDYANGCDAYSMNTAIHEVGHNIIDDVGDKIDSDTLGEHDTGVLIDHFGDKYTTPMSNGYWDKLDNTNECGDSVGDAPTGGKYADFRYSKCAGNYMG